VTTVLPTRAGVFAQLGNDAGRLLIGVSVYREPVDRSAALFQLGWRDPAAASGSALPYPEPTGLDELLAACESSGLLIVVRGARADRAPDDQPQTIYVDPKVAAELRRLLAPGERGRTLALAHRRAAEYWRWRSAAWPTGREEALHDLLEARQHLFDAGETEQAGELTGVLCAQLHARGSLGQEAKLVRDTLGWLPARSPGRAGWLRELGKIAEAQGDYQEAELRYQQALDIFAAVGDHEGVSRSHHSLGVLAQAQGDYAGAERRYEQAAGSEPPAPQPAAAGLPDGAGHPGDRGAQDAVEYSGGASHWDGVAFRNGASPHEGSAFPGDADRQHGGVLLDGTSPQDGASVQDEAGLPEDADLDGASLRDGAAPAGRHQRRPVPRRRRASGAAALIAAAAIVAGGMSVVFSAAPGTRAAPRADSGSRAGSAASARQAEIIRRDAAAWVAGHASRSAIVACDPAMCLTLQARGLPSGNLVVLGPGSGDPLGANLVVATSAVRSQFGARLASVYAPVVVASFGSGGERIEVRVVAPDGSAAYLTALRADRLARRRAGRQLLRNRRIGAGPAARRELARGLVDARVLMLLAAMAGSHPVDIAAFGGAGPGATGGLPLPAVTLARPRHGPASEYLRQLQAFVRAQRPPYLAASARVTRLDGRPALRILFAEPGPLGLLGSAIPGR
jgi:tetratricopeptide (TPR) repeat protein